MRPKYFFTYKNEDKIVSANCPKCNTEVTQRIETGYSWKCNCDVELTADMLDHADKDTELFLFSGDGDFEFLIEKVIAKGSKVTIVSSASQSCQWRRMKVQILICPYQGWCYPIGSSASFERLLPYPLRTAPLNQPLTKLIWLIRENLRKLCGSKDR